MFRSIASRLPQLASLCLVSAAIAACGSQKPGSSFDTAPKTSGSSSGSSGTGDDGSNPNYDAGSNNGGLNLQDAGAPPSQQGDAGCAGATSTATRQPVYMLFVLDGSGSMKDSSKWTAAVSALDSIFDDMQTKADPGVGVGLIVFSDKKDPTIGFGPYPSSPDVSIAVVDKAHHDALRARIDSSGPQGGTPTGTALTGGYGELQSFTASSPLPPDGKKVLVIITDGVPEGDSCDISGTNYAGNPCVTMAAQKLAMASPQGPIETFVIGVGNFPSSDLTSYDPSFLGYLAQAGGSSPQGCNPGNNTSASGLCYFEVDPSGSSTATQQAFETAIDNIRGQVASCTIPLKVDSDAGTLDPSKVNVQINGQTINQDPQNGWSYDNPNNPTQIILNGQACTDMKNTPNATINIVLGCATQIPPPAK